MEADARKGGEHPIVFDSTLSNPALELKVYGPSSKELLLTGDAGNELNPIHVWTGMCTTPCAVAFRHKTQFADLSAGWRAALEYQGVGLPSDPSDREAR